ncbi:Holliday junction resolvase RuvX [Cellulomonas endophytica]|uniref:Holliday junction resolvase RuvX n=1 Tax=Cellulomonas endophytica TaxID=2494735 RepID=UPI00101320D4|nr:Holliday junction resolvase RuvX [Cellulomonas endophytica]
MAEPGGPSVPRGARLAVDVGTVRVGLAASDADGLVATPVATLARAARPAPGAAWPADVATIVAEVEERGAQVVYVGLPRHLNGSEGSSSAAARAYAEALASAVAPVAVRLVDERMSTVSAHRALREAGRAGRKHRQVVDQAAAVVILTTALDAERATGRRSGEPVRPRVEHGQRRAAGAPADPTDAEDRT